MSVELLGFTSFEGRLSELVRRTRETARNAGKRVIIGLPKTVDPDVKLYAAVNEYGSADGHTPSRPALRLALRDTKLRDFARLQWREYFKSNVTLEQALRAIGERGAETARRYILSGVPPANAPATVKKKGHGRTLIDSGRYLRSITWDLV